MYLQKGCVASASIFISTPRKYENSRLIMMMIKLPNEPDTVLQDKKRKDLPTDL